MTKAGGKKRRGTPADAPKRGFDGILGELEEVVTALEEGELPLEEALAAFEKGVVLAREGERILTEADQRVELLIRDGRSAGGVRRERFTSEGAPGAGEPGGPDSTEGPEG